MNREERIEKAKQMAAAKAPPPVDVAHKRAIRLYQRLSNVGAAGAQRHVAAAERAGKATYIDPANTPGEWNRAVDVVRDMTIRRAGRRDKITHGEVKWAIFDDLTVLVDETRFVDLVIAVVQADDGVLLSSIIVDQDTGMPSDDVLLHGLELGFDEPPEILQRQVYQHFG